MFKCGSCTKNHLKFCATFYVPFSDFEDYYIVEGVILPETIIYTIDVHVIV